MQTKINRYHAVNWADGMKLTQNHFKEGDAHLHDSLRDVAASPLNSFNFGLLPPNSGETSSLSLNIYNHPNSHVEIILENCNILSANGSRMVYWQGLYGNMNPRLSVQASDMDATNKTEFYVLLNLNPYEGVPIGEPDPEEIPLRHPNLYPKISLHLMTKRQVNSEFIGAHQFIVGVLVWENQQFYWNEDYIPPCTSMSSHRSLLSFLEKTNSVFSQLKNWSVLIIRKNSFGKPVNNKLAQNTCRICEDILEFISTNIFEIKYIIKECPPILLVNKISLLANRINMILLTMEDRYKEELLQYYHEWENVRPVDFESVLGELMELEYNHSDIRAALVSIDKFLTTLSVVWSKLSQLEYVGQRKDNIVIREEVQKGNTVSKKWSLLD